MEVGELVGRGRTSDVYAYGANSVVKIPHDEVPQDWPEFEATLTQAVCAQGVMAPEVRDVIVLGGRTAVVFERVAGPSMWEQMLTNPRDAPTFARELASMQKRLLAIGIPPGIPELVDRLYRKINGAVSLSENDRAEARTMAGELPRGAALLHGDLHPGNVLMSAEGPVVIDWFDATIGHPVADIVRSSILMQPGGPSAPRHLPGASPELLAEVHRTYLAEFKAELDASLADLGSWQAVVAAGRLAEGAEVDEGGLIALWEARADESIAHAMLVDVR